MKRKDFGDLNLLTINDFKSIDIFELSLKDGEFVPLYGPNGSGKSTVMDSLITVFGGGAVPEGSIRDGKDEAKISIQTSAGYNVTKRIRTVKKGKDAGKQVTELVMTKDNQPVPKAQTVLKDMFAGFLTPTKIANAEGASLYKQIVQAAGVSPEKWDEAIANAKEQLRSEKIRLDMLNGMAVKPEGERPTDLVEFDPQEFSELSQRKAHLQNASQTFADQKQYANGMFQDIQELEAQLKRMKEDYEKKKVQLEELHEKAMNAPKELEEVDKKMYAMIQAKEGNNLITLWNQFDENSKKASDQKAVYDNLKEQVSNLEANRKIDIEQAETGIDGLKLTENGQVTFDGHVWKNVCFSDRMKIATLLTLENMPEDKLPIMFIEHGESLSKAKREEIATCAIEKGVTVFIEVMTEDTTNITDGVIMRVSDTAPVIKEPSVPHHEVIEAIQEQAKDFQETQHDEPTIDQRFDPHSLDLSGDLSKFSAEQIQMAVEAQMDKPNGVDNVLRNAYPEATKPYSYAGKKSNLEELNEDYPALGKQVEKDVAAKTPEQLGMGKAIDLPPMEMVEPPKPTTPPPAMPSLFDDLEEISPDPIPETKPETGTDESDPWDKPVLDIF